MPQTAQLGSNQAKAVRKSKVAKIWHGARAPSVGRWLKLGPEKWLNLDLSKKVAQSPN
jgi:hypothetical protein